MTAFKPSSLQSLSHDNDERGFSHCFKYAFFFLILDMGTSVFQNLHWDGGHEDSRRN